MQLPADWEYLEIEDPRYGWPIHWLRANAQYPHHHNTWLGGPVCLIANDDPPQPLAPDTALTTLLLLAEHHFRGEDGRIVRLYRMLPLHTSERQYEMEHGAEALMNALDAGGVSFVVDPNRPSVV